MTEPAPRGADDQELVGFMSNEAWDGLLGQVNGLVEKLEELPESEIRSDVFRLLAGIDTIHREALRRLVRLFKEGVLDKVVTDPAIHTLMELYDLLPASDGTQEQNPAPPIRFPTIPIRAVSSAPPAPTRYPHWLPVMARFADLVSGVPREVAAEEAVVLLCRRGDEVFAVESRCSRDGASMAGATLSGYTLTCPVHAGCHYDVRQGTPLGGGDGIVCYPARAEEDGRVLLGMDMDFSPRLPAS